MEEMTNGGKFYDFDGLAEPSNDEDLIFRVFRKKSVMAKKWIASLVDNGYRFSDRKRGRRKSGDDGLFMSDEMQEVGVLSVAPSLSALLFEVSLLKDDGEIEEGGSSFVEVLKKDGSRVLGVITKSICRLLSECYPDRVTANADRVLLSSMPFYDDEIMASSGRGWDNGGYLDSASWVFLAADSIEAYLTRLEKSAPDVYNGIKWEIERDGENRNNEILSVEEVKKAVRAIYLSCIKVTCDCIVRRNGKVLGWSFRKMGSEAEPSLYFSYVASTVYLGLYNRFNGSDDRIDRFRRFESQLVLRDQSVRRFKFYDGIVKPETRKKTAEKLASYGFEEFASFISGLSQDVAEEIDLLYNVINNGQPLTYKLEEYDDSGAFTLLKEASVEFAKSLWEEGFGNSKNRRPFKTHMAKGPCFEDGSPVNMEVVRLSSHNNAFFNNLFVIGIILNSAYDAEVKAESEEKYNEMLNIFQLSIQNTQRCYNEIASEGLLYKVDSYILDFSEKVDADNAELAKQLRKVNIAAVPLMPLILKNNNLMSQYVVKYPQKQMTESLKDIIANKKNKGDGESWVWDKDGFNAITNYYYVDALISFYRYYEKFEAPFIAGEEDFRSVERKARKEEENKYAELIRAKEKAFKEEIAEKDKYLAEMRGISKAVARFVVNGLIDLVDEQFTPDNLLGNLDGNEVKDTEKIIDRLNSIDRDSDVVKLTRLVRLTEKLQLLSLLAMKKDDDIKELIKNGTSVNERNESYNLIIRKVFGDGGDISGFMRNLASYLADKSDRQGSDNENK